MNMCRVMYYCCCRLHSQSQLEMTRWRLWVAVDSTPDKIHVVPVHSDAPPAPPPSPSLLTYEFTCLLPTPVHKRRIFAYECSHFLVLRPILPLFMHLHIFFPENICLQPPSFAPLTNTVTWNGPLWANLHEARETHDVRDNDRRWRFPPASHLCPSREPREQRGVRTPVRGPSGAKNEGLRSAGLHARTGLCLFLCWLLRLWVVCGSYVCTPMCLCLHPNTHNPICAPPT